MIRSQCTAGNSQIAIPEKKEAAHAAASFIASLRVNRSGNSGPAIASKDETAFAKAHA